MSIFKESISYRPFMYSWAVEAAKTHSIDMHWHEGQIDLTDDVRQWNAANGLATKNTSHEVNKYIISKITNLFTEMDKMVGEGYTQIIPYVKNNEIRNLLITHVSREVIHQRAYALLSETLGTSDSGWREFREYVEMQEKLDVMTIDEGDLSKPLNWAKAIGKILLGEGIGLFGSFSVLLNYKRHGLLMGFNDVNSWSLNDEDDHVENNIRILHTVMREDLTEVERIELKRYLTKVAAQYAEAEKVFLKLVYAMGDAEDMTFEEACGYIDYIHDLRLYQLDIIGFEDVRPNTLPWMEWLLGAEKHGSFFEKRIAEYSHRGLVGEIDYTKYQR